MSRVYEDGDEPDYNNAYELWQWNLAQSLGSRRGQQALRDLRDALLALPERRLIARALCTVGEQRIDRDRVFAADLAELIDEQGEGVCIVGAYAWHKKVKAGLTVTAAFDALPTLDDLNHGDWETANVGAEHGLARTLAFHLAYLNDLRWGNCTPEERWQRCLEWLDLQLAEQLAVQS